MRRSHGEGRICFGMVILYYQRCFNASANPPYRRRSSDPQTVREKGDFRRDMKFSKQRPLPNVPWLQDKKRTYMDDAERLYGRKEAWCRIEDKALREKLASLLQDYLRDTIDATKQEVRDARKYMQLCDRMDAEYRAYVTAAAFSSPQLLRTWAVDLSQKKGEETQSLHTSNDCQQGILSEVGNLTSAVADEKIDNGKDDNEEGGHMDESNARRDFVKARRLQGEQAILENTPATMDLSAAEKRNAPYSAFPFLRQRALENEASLDPSLVDWTAKYFPEDDDRTFTSPPKLRNDVEEDKREDGGSAASSSRGKPTDGSGSLHPKQNVRRRLQRSLRIHEDTHRPTFDAEGAFYRVRRQGNEEDRAPKPRAARGSDASSDRDREVVKVSWDTVVKAKEPGYSADILRAKERLIRLSRGEDPQTIP
ncbi:putative U4/U6 small nuclear ribonuclear protein [Trypanosoma grayi]|uniref:putative U4/U6 small nuclear ribonuclear protein n=1 Tax=Trypanosoma grayi TaxID=71804 RepID=UPI0004F40018|nr:putative U4/U6 small nuclear ribonuclear protein [Trypanosoma grayi]KEG14107.1 putative U4/U6 small nuclear ribonuclear protein [Trypanosoma grayi]